MFGVSSDEYIGYALANREEWERKGEQIVAEMVEKYCVDDVILEKNEKSQGDISV